MSRACEPPGVVAAGSSHWLKSPSGRPMAFSWAPRAKSWIRPGGNRASWTAASLALGGWTYVGPV